MSQGAALDDFVEVMRRLRAECPWKAEQTHRSLVRYLLEETAEVVEAIDEAAADPTDPAGDAHLVEELGDLLLQVVFHAAIGEEQGRFDLDDVAAGIATKMRRRNPHVFGSDADRPGDLSSAAVNDVWQQIKAEESPRRSPLDGLPAGLPALLLADKAVDRLTRAGRELPPAGDDLGDRLLALVVEAHETGGDPEQALRDAVRRAVGPAT